MYSTTLTETRSSASGTIAPPDVADDLVLAHLALAEAIAERWSRRVNDRLDLRQVAYLGLVQAARRFDRRTGSAFAAFAAAYIRGELLHYLRDTARVVRVPRGVLASAASAVGSLGSPLSLDAPVLSAGDVVPLSSTVGDFDRRLDESDARVPLFAALRILPDEARLVVYLRYFEDLTQAEIARRTGSTQKAVSRSLDGSLRALRRELDRPGPHREARGTVRH